MSNEMVISERFANNVVMQYTSEVGKNSFGEYEKMLMQHLFIKIDFSIKELQKNPNYKDLKWDNINMAKLAIDSVNRIQLGLDGLIQGHIYPIAYRNSKTGLYELDLRIGYKGELIYKKKTSLYEINDIVIKLAYENDIFVPYFKDKNNEIENYEFNTKDIFNRGNLKGAFGYIDYKDKTRNKLETVNLKDIEKAKGFAQSKKFWEGFFEDMVYKTIVKRTCKHIEIDPEKINKAFFEAENIQYEEIEEKEIIDITDENKIEDKQDDKKDIPIEEKTNVDVKEPEF